MILLDLALSFCFFLGIIFDRLAVKKQAAETKKSKKAAKDPNKPKRPPSAFFVFMYALLLPVYFRSISVCTLYFLRRIVD